MNPQAPTTGVLTARAAYAQVLALWIIAAGPGIWLSLAHATGLNPAISGLWSAIGRLAAGVWLIVLLHRRGFTAATRGALLALGAAVLAPAVLLASGALTLPAAAALQTVVATVTLLWLTYEVLRRHGLLTRNTTPGPGGGRARRLHLMWTVPAALALIMVSVQLMVALRPDVGGCAATAPCAGADSRVYVVSAHLWAAATEELVLTAAVVFLLSAARLPLRHIVLTCALVRTIPLLHLGPSALAMLLLGAGAAYLLASSRHWRTTAIVLFAVHFAWGAVLLDLIRTVGITTTGQRWLLTTAVVATAAAARICYQAAAPAAHRQPEEEGTCSGQPTRQS